MPNSKKKKKKKERQRKSHTQILENKTKLEYVLSIETSLSSESGKLSPILRGVNTLQNLNTIRDGQIKTLPVTSKGCHCWTL